MNGQENDAEVDGGFGNTYTAEFWEYDARIGRRFNIDPVVKPWESSYAAFSDNPIYFSDPNGDDPKEGDGANPKQDSKGAAGTTAPNGGTRNGKGGVSGGKPVCLGCGSKGEDAYGIPNEPQAGTGNDGQAVANAKGTTINSQLVLIIMFFIIKVHINRHYIS